MALDMNVSVEASLFKTWEYLKVQRDHVARGSIFFLQIFMR